MIYKIQGTLNTSNLTRMEQFVLARFCYRNGIEYWTDEQYDCFARELAGLQPENRYVLSSYEDDPIDIGLLERAGFTDEDINYFISCVRVESSADTTQYRDALTEGVTKSITPLFTFRECYEAAKAFTGKELCISLKVDGIHVKALYRQTPPSVLHTLRFAATQGRAQGSTAIDITRNVSRIFPKSFLSESLGDIFIDGECFCYESAIDYINGKYDLNLKVPRSAGLSMIRTTEYEDVDYQFVNILLHDISLGDTKTESFEIARSLGFETVPYFKHVFKSTTYDDFCKEVLELVDKIAKMGEDEGLTSDGMVVSLNSKQELLGLRSDSMYDGGVYAFKIGKWSPGIYTSRVQNILCEQQADRMSFKAIIDPIKTQSGIVVSTINLYNLAMIIKNGITVGSEITFQYKNETTPLLIERGKSVNCLEG